VHPIKSATLNIDANFKNVMRSMSLSLVEKRVILEDAL